MRARAFTCTALATCALLFGTPAARAAEPLQLTVDAREVSRNIVHMTLEVPIVGGTVTMVFPKWVPGEHGPANPVVDLAVLAGSVNGKRVTWERDPVDLYTFRFDTPADARTLELHYDALLSPGYTTPNLALLNWNPTLLYPSEKNIHTATVAAHLLLPPGWQFATALDHPQRSGDRVDFAPVSIERLFDSPVLAGSNLASFPLDAFSELDVAGDSPVAPRVNDAVKAHFSALVTQARLLFDSYHWRPPYRFLITATDAIGYTGLEHHESSWNGVDTDTLASEAAAKRFAGDLLTHEFTHSWNGKYRRPEGLYRNNYQEDETTDLLWVYEGLTEYYSDILAVRSGFWTPADYRAALAAKYAYLDAESGRTTRALADTTFEPRLGNGRSFTSARRAGSEYYDESELMWLDADTLIREGTRGARSLDDFARVFYGGESGAPKVVPYSRADVVAALNTVYAYDWEDFFRTRIDVPTAHPPRAGIERAGYTFAFAAKTDTPNPSTRIGANAADYRYGFGAVILPSGTIRDLIAGSPAAKAGLAPGMTIVGVDNRRWSAAGFAATIERDATSHAPMVLLLENRGTFTTRVVRYDGGVRIPTLVRASGPDLIEAIVQARSVAP
jgi:predicted metalloprotease with PDZ domain